MSTDYPPCPEVPQLSKENGDILLITAFVFAVIVAVVYLFGMV